jgi:hypothetical protein
VIARRDDALMEMLSQPRSFAELLEQGIIYRQGSRPPVFGESVERRSIQMHLDRLCTADVVVEHDGLFSLT